MDFTLSSVWVGLLCGERQSQDCLYPTMGISVVWKQVLHIALDTCGMAQYNNAALHKYTNSHYKNKTVMAYLYNGNPYAWKNTVIFWNRALHHHYCDVIIGAMASQITSLTIVYLIVHSDADQRKHQSSASLAFVWGIHRSPVNSPHKWPVTRKMFPFDDVIMRLEDWLHFEHCLSLHDH